MPEGDDINIYNYPDIEDIEDDALLSEDIQLSPVKMRTPTPRRSPVPSPVFAVSEINYLVYKVCNCAINNNLLEEEIIIMIN